MQEATNRGMDAAYRFGKVPEMPEQYPNRIREWRKAKGLTLERLAAELGSNNVTLSRYETGKRSVTLDLLAQIAQALDCKPADLLPDPESVLDAGQRELADAYRDLAAPERETLLRVARALRSSATREAVLPLRRKVN